ncbi:MAG: hypothetical protein M5U28_36050 [Sandaracinaceae bacterium]|nr:hypothetical protein [Sandaracinaceae bacterium]
MSIDLHTRLLIAVTAKANPKTVARYFSGAPLKPISERRIVDALRELGMDALVRPSTPPEAA